MHKIRFSLFAVAFLIALICFDSPAAFGQPFTISPSISSSGTTLLTLSGLGNACLEDDQTNAVVAPPNIAVNTHFHGVPCFAAPPPSFLIVRVDVGFLPVGHYNVTWNFDVSSIVTLAASTQFDVTAAPIPRAIPTIGTVALLMSAFAIGVFGMLAFQKNASSRSGR
jgi:hypothetical protein